MFVYKQLKEEIRKTMELIVEQCVSSDEQKIRVLKSRAEPQDFDCYKKAVKTFSKNCYNLGKVMITVFYFCRLTLHAEKRIILIIKRFCFPKTKTFQTFTHESTFAIKLFYNLI